MKSEKKDFLPKDFPVVIHQGKIQEILNSDSKNKAELLGVYTFLNTRARQNQTNQPWVNTQYIQKGLDIGRDKTIRLIKELISFGVITRLKAKKGRKSLIRINQMMTVKKLVDLLEDEGLVLQIVTRGRNEKDFAHLWECPHILGYLNSRGAKTCEKRKKTILKALNIRGAKPVGKEKKTNLKALKTRANNACFPTCLKALKSRDRIGPENQGPKCLKGTSSNNEMLKGDKSKSKSHSGRLKSARLWDSANRCYLNPYGIKRNPPELKDTDPKHPDNKYYRVVAQKLKDINENYYDHHHFADSLEWVTPIRLLVQSDMKSKKPTKQIKARIKKVLAHYEKHIGERYCHELKSGKSFRAKFFKVEDKFKRKEENSGNSPVIKNNFIYKPMKKRSDDES